VEHVFPRFWRRRRTKVAQQETQVQAQERALGLARERGGEGVQVEFRGGEEDGEERRGSSVQRVEDDGAGVLDAGDERGADGLLGMESELDEGRYEKRAPARRRRPALRRAAP
jgi:hypothetical protein